MRIISYNVNGIRAAVAKGLLEWIKKANPDVLCLQEIKASPAQLRLGDYEEIGYHHYWYPAQKKGYSGVAIFTKQKPLHVEYGCGQKEYDDEGRVMRVDFEEYSIMSVYHPSGSSSDERQAFKMEWLAFFQKYINQLKIKFPKLILSGDFNICHKAIDIHNPVSNAKSSGFLPEERDWMENFITGGFIDSFRYFNSMPHQYSWWSYRSNSRNKNLGWRLDYNFVSANLQDKLLRALILAEVKQSDHCPVLVELI